jgi:hypothetical protein
MKARCFKPRTVNFGLPVVLCTYEVKTPDRTVKRTDQLIPQDASQWDVFNLKQSAQAKPEKQIHKRVILKTEGISLLDTPGPRHLVEGIVHAILGESILLSDDLQ